MYYMRFTSEFIEQVRQANDIVSVISDYVSLKRRGCNFWACCPFHNEKTASFSVASDKGFYYCFGCHAHGDVFQFVMARENISFSEAVERLAERAHIPLPEVEKSAEDMARDKKRDRLYEINEMAGNFFHNCLVKTRYGEPGLAYFHRRHLTNETIHSFKLGFAPDSWDKLTRAFEKKGVTGKELLEVGLAKEKNGHYYDAFRNRVMFPIRDGRGRIVGFGGRVLDDSKPKYLNSPETLIFNKRHLLFAMDKAHKAIFDEGRAILVEGYMDVISAHNRGICNVVASLGTAFTEEQARLLQRQAKELVLSYDMDTAGRQATLRAMEIVRGLGLHVRVVTLPQGKDPDEYINTAGPEKLREAIENAPNVLDYMLMTALKQYDDTTLDGKADIVAMLIPVLAQEDNRIVLETFMKKIAAKLQVDENAVRNEFNKYVTAHPETRQQQVVISRSVYQENAAVRGKGKNAVSEENILRFLVEKPEACARMRELVVPKFFTSTARSGIFEKILELQATQGTYTLADFQPLLTQEESGELARIMVLPEVPMSEAVITDYVKRFRLAELQQQYKEYSARAAAYGQQNDPRLVETLAMCKKIQNEMKRWA